MAEPGSGGADPSARSTRLPVDPVDPVSALEVFERAGRVVRPRERLGQLVPRRPEGITGNQWNAAARAILDFVVSDPDGRAATFAVEFVDASTRTARSQRGDRMKQAVCDAVGLGLLRIESGTLQPVTHGRRIVEYVLDARAFREAVGDPAEYAELVPDGPLSYRDIVGRLPDGSRGHVNDLGAVARTVAVEAYVDRELVDPILRSLHVEWRGGPAQGWAWLQVRPGEYLFEQVRLWQHRFSYGVEPGRLAEDLATMAVGERLRRRDAIALPLAGRARLTGALDALRQRRDELANPYAFEHISFD
ncbi:DUF2726 domain-containing protein [Plantactinospora sp. WMMB334]|uniref:DUF2726 domain-containing protein n=1 Tax=Plantactinospora sp. WMMB334 TaxID=3404119 RepID=UPI003B9393A5